jgi:branched-chain amino acid transport system permease protein
VSGSPKTRRRPRPPAPGATARGAAVSGMMPRLAASVVITVLGFFIPTVITSANGMTVMVNGLVLGLMALSVGFLLNLLGWVSFGAAAFSGGAAYLFAILCVSAKMSLTEAAVLALAGSVVGGMLIGLVFVRSKALVFTMLTLALGQLLYQVVTLDQYSGATGGTNGLVVAYHGTFFGMSAAQLADPVQVWPLIWGVAVILVAACYLVGRSRFGRVLRGIRENETRMQHSGYNTYLPKLAAFGIAGFIGAVAGVLSAANVGFISPELLTFEASGTAIIAALIGGYQTAIGPVIGGLLMDWGQNEFGSTGHLYLYTGIAVIVVLVLFPRGLSGLAVELWQQGGRQVRRSRQAAGSQAAQDQAGDGGGGRVARERAAAEHSVTTGSTAEGSAHAVD